MRHIMLHMWPDKAAQYLPTLLNIGTIFGGGESNIKCVCFDFLYKFSETFLILRRFQRDFFVNMHRSSCTVPVILVRVGELEFSKSTQMSSNM